MHLFNVAFYFSGVFYALFIDRTLFIPFFFVIALYFVLGKVVGGKDVSVRKKLMMATWSHPEEGVIIVKVPARVEKVKECIAKCKDVKLTYTHFAIKAIGELLKQLPDLNGTLTMGKFVPYETVNISCLVDIDGGKDLAMVLVEGVDKMSVEEIASFISAKAGKIKKSDGGEDHKKTMKPFKMIPAFLVSALTVTLAFISNKLGLSLPALKLKKHAMGAACVTSLGMLGFEDAIAPFTGFANCTVLCALNAVTKQPVVEDDKVVVGEVLNANFVVDHRYVDGGRAKGLVAKMKRVFEEPQDYMTGGKGIHTE